MRNASVDATQQFTAYTSSEPKSRAHRMEITGAGLANRMPRRSAVCMGKNGRNTIVAIAGVEVLLYSEMLTRRGLSAQRSNRMYGRRNQEKQRNGVVPSQSGQTRLQLGERDAERFQQDPEDSMQ